ncbi:helix-turn-helix transcriptional regulator [Halomonas cupida]|uniref:helix-turn-helix transcriptional regulator n=1 Tax=Halomonas TaxID=2745 RepID=UPI001A8CCD65|nr:MULTISPECIES: AraC family transcriptional regulator [Halomonas]MBN8414073.1 helix-turn-helix transcriptional regulator [Halomonas litopenaei]MBY5985779.1 AraC family transcriptional regulator [Halomonas sp. DP5Y7-2]
MTTTFTTTQPKAPQAGWIHQHDLTSLAGVLTSQYQCTAADHQATGAPLHGIVQQHEVQRGMYLRLNRLRDRHGVTPRARLHPGLKISLVWRGEACVSFDEHSFTLDANKRACGLLIAVDEPTTFVRHGRRGAVEFSAVLSLTSDWLQRRLGSPLPSVCCHGLRQHLGHLRWTPSSDLVARLNSVSQTADMTTVLNLERESIALAMVSEALAHQTTPAVSHDGKAWQQRLAGWIASGESLHLSPADMASRLGMSLRQLQRRYHREYGLPLSAGLRQQHLLRARAALQDENVSVDTAASIAGYRHAANFATAFKQHFGEGPAQCRRHAQRELSTDAAS